MGPPYPYQDFPTSHAGGPPCPGPTIIPVCCSSAPARRCRGAGAAPAVVPQLPADHGTLAHRPRPAGARGPVGRRSGDVSGSAPRLRPVPRHRRARPLDLAADDPGAQPGPPGRASPRRPARHPAAAVAGGRNGPLQRRAAPRRWPRRSPRRARRRPAAKTPCDSPTPSRGCPTISARSSSCITWSIFPSIASRTGWDVPPAPCACC